MHLFLFLDDWMLDAYQDIVRRFPRPVAAPVDPWEGPHFHVSVFRDPEAGTYRCWYHRFLAGRTPAAECTSLRDLAWGIFLAESDDGVHWTPYHHGGPVDPVLPGWPNSIAMPQRPDGSGEAKPRVIFRDDRDADASRRYKAVDKDGWLLFSPDGVHWRSDPKYRAFSFSSDTKNNIFWNPVTGRYQVHFRPVHVDRRIVMSESADLENWTYRGVVFQPDAQDPPLLQIYSMMAFWYEDLFIAFPDLFRVPHGEVGRRHKMLGYDEVGLAYSYNGSYWLRPYHEPFMPVTEPGTYGGGIHAPGDMVLGDDDVLRIYVCGNKIPHNDGSLMLDYTKRGEEYAAVLTYTLRKDGFACLEPLAGWGWLRTRVLLPQDADLSLNVQAPTGQVLTQVTDEAGQPLPGFAFEDSVPFEGDGVAVRPRWVEGRLGELVGKPCRLEFKLFNARLYAFRWQCQVYYASEPQDRI